MNPESLSLVNHVKKLDQRPIEHRIKTLELRKLKELEFHNKDRNRDFLEEAQRDSDTYEKFYGNKKYYKTTLLSKNYVDKWIRDNCANKICLDYACGNGEHAFKMLDANSKLVLGMDISDISIENCKSSLKSHDKRNDAVFFWGDCENTLLPDNSIEIIICSGMLHHLDLNFAFPEIKRILKPGGKVLAIEALDYNPLIKLYRMLTPNMRTEWEKAHILSLKDIRHAKKYFDVKNINYWHITSYAAGKFPLFLKPLNQIDRFLTKIPILRLMSWIFTFELVKRQ